MSRHHRYLADDGCVHCTRCRKTWPLYYDHVVSATPCAPGPAPWKFWLPYGVLALGLVALILSLTSL